MNQVTKRHSRESSCPECNSTDTYRSDGDLVCKKCSTVISQEPVDKGKEWSSYSFKEEMEKTRVGPPSTNRFHDKRLTTKIGPRNRDGYGNSLSSEKRKKMARLRKWNKRHQISNSERNLKQGLSEIDRMASALDIPKPTREIACSLFRRVQDKDMLVGRSIETVASVSLYIACRMDEIPRSTDEIGRVSRASRKRIKRFHLDLIQEFNLNLGVQDPQNYIPRYCTKLNLSNETEKRALKMVKKFTDAHPEINPNPISLAAAAIYAAVIYKGEQQCRQEDIAEVTDISSSAIREYYEDMIDTYEGDNTNLTRQII